MPVARLKGGEWEELWYEGNGLVGPQVMTVPASVGPTGVLVSSYLYHAVGVGKVLGVKRMSNAGELKWRREFKEPRTVLCGDTYRLTKSWL